MGHIRPGSHRQHKPDPVWGYYYDNETGLYYLQSRYYDPTVGRFLNADATFDDGAGLLGYNLFAYCANNPINMVDPNGASILAFTAVFAKIFLVVAATIIVIALLIRAGSSESYI